MCYEKNRFCRALIFLSASLSITRTEKLFLFSTRARSFNYREIFWTFICHFLKGIFSNRKFVIFVVISPFRHRIKGNLIYARMCIHGRLLLILKLNLCIVVFKIIVSRFSCGSLGAYSFLWIYPWKWNRLKELGLVKIVDTFGCKDRLKKFFWIKI